MPVLHFKTSDCFLILFIVIFLGADCFGQNQSERNRGSIFPDSLNAKDTAKIPAIQFYQKWLSPVKGNHNCPMYPSCSMYAQSVFRELPWYRAYCKTLERLLRCGNDLYFYPALDINGNIRWYDAPLFIRGTSQNTAVAHGIPPSKRPQKNSSVNGKRPQQSFADFLFSAGQYSIAVKEYYRQIYQADSADPVVGLYEKIGLCYFRQKDYRAYISFYEKNHTHFRADSEAAAKMENHLGKSYYFLGDYQKTLSVIEWGNEVAGNLLNDQNQFLTAFSHAHLFHWKRAIQTLKQVDPESPRKKIADRISQSLENADRLPYRSPLGAAILSSVVPGAGYFYCNHKATAVTSLIVNGLFIWTIRDAIVKEQYGLASAAGFLSIGWYIGNITGSMDAATAHNTRIRNKFIDRLLEEENLSEYRRQ